LRRFARGTNQSAALINWMNQLGALDEKLRENMQRKFINLQVEAGAAAFRLHAPKPNVSFSHRLTTRESLA